MLPRLPNETGTIKVNLKRLQYKSSALSLNVRPQNVAEAAKWLVNNGNLYKEDDISFNDTWLEAYPIVFDASQHENDELTKASPDRIECNTENINCGTYFNKTQQTHDDKDQWSEDEVEIPAGVTDHYVNSPRLCD